MNDPSAELDPVEVLAEEFAERYRQGERPSLDEYAQKFPHLAEQIRDLFPAMVLMEELAPKETLTATAGVPRRLGEYRIVREVGRGGMGVVYEAEQEPLGRHVALKVLPFHGLMDSTHLERFHREARAAARLHHTNIVPVYGVGEQDGIHYFAMQFIDGRGLDAVLRDVKRLRSGTPQTDATHPSDADATGKLAENILTGQFAAVTPSYEQKVPEVYRSLDNADTATQKTGSTSLSTSSGHARTYFSSVARIGVQVAEALAYAHGQGILHRDIKPSNLLLDLKGTVWVTDFGLAKAEGSGNLTQAGDVVGTLRYMAPERFEGRSDPRSDIYGLGLTLYEMLTLRPAFEQTDRGSLIREVTQEAPPSPRRLDRRIPLDLETIVLKSTAKDPDRRYASAGKLAEDLRRFLADRPIVARRVTAWEHTWRWCRRNPALAMLITSVALLLVVITTGASVAAWRLGDQLQQTEEAEGRGQVRLFDSLFSQAQARRWSGRPGRRFQSLEALAEAARMVPTLGYGPDKVLELRNEAIAAMTLADLRVDPTWKKTILPGTAFCFDRRLERYACADKTGNVWVAHVVEDEVILRLPTLESCTGSYRAGFSPDGRFLAVIYSTEPNRFQIRVWDLTIERAVFQAALLSPNAFDFSPDGHAIAVVHSGGVIVVTDLSSMQECACPVGGFVPEFILFHPRGDVMAVCSTQSFEVQIINWRTGEVLKTLSHPEPEGDQRGVQVLAWHPEGKMLAAGRADHMYLWDADTGKRLWAFAAHEARVVQLGFSHGGDLLASGGFDEIARLWDPYTGKQLINTQGRPI